MTVVAIKLCMHEHMFIDRVTRHHTVYKYFTWMI